jgi:CheY-like chemotaxis protein/two-component sensor histidine kinase
LERIDPHLLSPAAFAAAPPAASAALPRLPRALVVDDDAVGRLSLRKLLTDCGYEAVLARNGVEGLERFAEQRPDIVFMDMLMPVMDGLEATMRIKQLCGHDFVPVIFVTGNAGDDDLERCIGAGGDDFLVKPYNRKALAAKIRAMERIRALHQRTSALHARLQDEQVLAKAILEGAVMGPNVRPAPLTAYLAPATTFNGDLLLSAYAPGGDLHVLLGDFTGHGLAATIGALPAAETFRAMTTKGFGPAQILAEINSKLRAILPTGIFLAVAFLRIDRSLARASLINCGMPDAWQLRGAAVQASFASTSLPLAVLDSYNYEADEVVFSVAAGERIILVSDGALEAGNPAGQLLGSGALRAAIEAGIAAGQSPIASAVHAIDVFCDGAALADDVSLVDIELVDALFPAPEADAGRRAAPARTDLHESISVHDTAAAGWRLALELRGQALRDVSPVPLLMSLLKEFPGTAQQSQRLFTVLSELYNNALDHGVLGLDSGLKDGDFSAYLDARDAQLAGLREGRVSVQIDCGYREHAGQMEIAVEDTGLGFDPAALVPVRDDAPHGRGLLMVRQMCQSLEFEAQGARARALYAWRDNPGAAAIRPAAAG